MPVTSVFCHVELQNLIIWCHTPLFTNYAHILVPRNIEISSSKCVLPSLVLPGIGCVMHGEEGARDFCHLTSCAPSGSYWFKAGRTDCSCRLFLQPTGHFRAMATCPLPAVASPSPMSWEHITLPSWWRCCDGFSL